MADSSEAMPTPSGFSRMIAKIVSISWLSDLLAICGPFRLKMSR
jgi:hypothetical protein